ncbi:hypothetical protein [Branchiibius hedensis]|uniref:hypothetical protein n=1 Tax=Branchiibius hedensis TaxID=672460 RepID=UPI0011B25D02|nr:hypothetical protein [Branchiibius hedensis]
MKTLGLVTVVPVVAAAAISLLPSTATAITPIASRDALLAGRILGSDGSAASGTRVQLLAWPQSIPVGGKSLRLQQIATATSGDNGAFRLSVAAGDLSGVADPAQQSSEINVDVVASSKQQLSVYATTIYVHHTSDGESLSFASEPDPASEASVGSAHRFAEATTQRSTAFTGSPTNQGLVLRLGVKAQGRTGSTPTTRSVQPFAQGSSLVANLGTKEVIVGDLSSTTGASGYSAYWTYEKSSTSTLGVAVSDDKYTGFSSSGHSVESSTVTMPFPSFHTPGIRYARTGMQYGKFLVFDDGGSGYVNTWYEVRAYKWIGGSSQDTQAATAFSHCRRYVGGGYGRPVEKTSSSATTWTNAVTIPEIGIKLSAETGFSGTAKADFALVNGRVLFLCGRNDYFASNDAYSVEIRGS